MKILGLTPEQVNASRAQNGSNVLTPPKRKSWWQEFLSKFEDPVIPNPYNRCGHFFWLSGIPRSATESEDLG